MICKFNCFFLLVISAFWSCSNNSQTSGGGTHGGNPVEFTGIILNENNEPQENVEVQLIPDGQVPFSMSAKVFADSTNARGEFSIIIPQIGTYSAFNLSAIQKNQNKALFKQHVFHEDSEASKIELGENSLAKTGALKISLPSGEYIEGCNSFIYVEGSPFYQKINSQQTDFFLGELPPGLLDVRLGVCEDVAAYSIPITTREVQSNDTIHISLQKEAGTMHFVSPTGSDTNSGSQSSPWASVQHAAEYSQAGDTILVLQGNYNEFVQVDQSGALFSPLVIRSEDSATLVGMEINGDHIIVEGFHFEYMGNDSSDVGIHVNGDHILIQQNRFIDLPHWAIRVGSRNVYPQSVRILDNKVIQGGAGFILSGDYMIIENNQFQQLTYKSGNPDAITFFGSNIRMKNNYIWGASPEDVTGSATGITAFQTWDNNGEYARNILISGNRIDGVNSCFVLEGLYYGQNRDFVLTNNVCSQIWLYTGVVHGIHDFDLLHNTFFASDTQGIAFRGKGENTRVYNNIFSQCKESFTVENDDFFSADYNLYHATDLSEWDGTHSYSGNPLFADTAASDFSLLPNSEAIDRGENVGVNQDAAGNNRPLGEEPDIGAYEYSP